MTAAVPDPRFRDKLADEIAGWPLGVGYYQYTVGTDDAQEMADALLPVISAEVQARVAAAANQQTARELRGRAAMVRTRAANEESLDHQEVADALDEVSAWLDARAAALAQPAPGKADT